MRDTTGKGDGKKETLHEESTAEGQREQVMETLKKKLCWVNSGETRQERGTAGRRYCMIKTQRERDKTWDETLKEKLR